MRNVKPFLGLVIVVALASNPVVLSAQRPEAAGEAQGPPSWVVEAWESGEAPVVPENGPPAWLVEAWQNGTHPRSAGGGISPPAWVLQRQAVGKELGLPGPPQEVLDASQNGEGDTLPGPPDFVLDLLSMFIG